MKFPITATILFALLCGTSCQTKTQNEKKSGDGPSFQRVPLAERLPAHFPTTLNLSAYAGSKSCSPCHPVQFKKWAGSAHGQAMATPSDATVKARFDGKPVQISTGRIIPLVQDGAHTMVLEGELARESHTVDLVLAYGRQHQVYFTQLEDGAYKMLPIEWSTAESRWMETKHYQPNELDPRSAKHWHRADAQLTGCMNCHLSQGHVAIEDHEVKLSWTQLQVNCESCHGPGKSHIATKKNLGGDLPDPYGALLAMGQWDDARVCGRCHDKNGLYAFPEEGKHSLDTVNAWTLGREGLRIDGTQYGVAYQMGGHLLSECFNGGAMACVHCHDPHTDKARDMQRRSAEGKFTNRQCDVCHRNYIDPKAAAKHSHHQESVSCVDCHMGYSWIHDDPATTHKTSDHSIQTPRPAESILAGLPNACVTCHVQKTNEWALQALKKWGGDQSVGVRPWLQTVHAATSGADNVGPQLVALLQNEKTPWMLRLSALELLGRQRVLNPETIAAVKPFAKSDDPQIRTYALATLMDHDVSGRWSWTVQALKDPHFLVQTAGVDGVLMQKQAGRMSSALTEQIVDRELAYSRDPFGALWRIGKLYESRNQWEYALEAAEIAAKWMKPSQRHLGFDRWYQALRNRTPP